MSICPFNVRGVCRKYAAKTEDDMLLKATTEANKTSEA